MNWMEWGRKKLWFRWWYYLDIWLRCLWKITKSAGQLVSWPDKFQMSVTANFSVAIFTLPMTLFGWHKLLSECLFSLSSWIWFINAFVGLKVVYQHILHLHPHHCSAGYMPHLCYLSLVFIHYVYTFFRALLICLNRKHAHHMAS